jgi:uncharacterized protein
VNAERLLLDTTFVQALLNRRDQYHRQAAELLPRVRAAAETWITEAVLVEVGNGLSTVDRQAAATFIGTCYQPPNMYVVSVDTPLLMRAVRL